MTSVGDVEKHPKMLEGISEKYPNTIYLLESDRAIDRYTCLMYVFDFVEKPEYIQIASMGLGRVYAGAEFAQWLLDHGKLEEVAQSQAANGDIIFYFSEKQFKHAGFFYNHNRVISKWGRGYLYEHELFEVPESYGNTVRYFRCPSHDDAYFYFTEFAEENGIEFEDKNY